MAQSAAYENDAMRQATYQDVLDAPPQLVAEIIYGTLYTRSRSTPRHARASSVLGGALSSLFDWGIGGPGGWRILDKPELHFGEQVLVPDVAGWRRERMPEMPDTAYFTLAPDWVCEVLSDSTRRVDLLKKRPIYACEGIAHLWFIELTKCTLEAFEIHDGNWTLIASVKDDETEAVPPFEAVPFNVGKLWG